MKPIELKSKPSTFYGSIISLVLFQYRDELITKACKDISLVGQYYEVIIRVQEFVDKAIEKAKRMK